MPPLPPLLSFFVGWGEHPTHPMYLPRQCVHFPHVFVQQIFTESLSCVRPHAGCWTKSTPFEFSSLAGGVVFQV